MHCVILLPVLIDFMYSLGMQLWHITLATLAYKSVFLRDATLGTSCNFDVDEAVDI
jgi:hypothetical protein